MNTKNLGVLDNENFNLNKYLVSEPDYIEDRHDEKLEAYKLESEISSLRDWMKLSNIPAFGSIMPGLTIDDTRATVRSLHYMIK